MMYKLKIADLKPVNTSFSINYNPSTLYFKKSLFFIFLSILKFTGDVF